MSFCEGTCWVSKAFAPKSQFCGRGMILKYEIVFFSWCRETLACSGETILAIVPDAHAVANVWRCGSRWQPHRVSSAIAQFSDQPELWQGVFWFLQDDLSFSKSTGLSTSSELRVYILSLREKGSVCGMRRALVTHHYYLTASTGRTTVFEPVKSRLNHDVAECRKGIRCCVEVSGSSIRNEELANYAIHDLHVCLIWCVQLVGHLVLRNCEKQTTTAKTDQARAALQHAGQWRSLVAARFLLFGTGLLWAAHATLTLVDR